MNITHWYHWYLTEGSSNGPRQSLQRNLDRPAKRNQQPSQQAGPIMYTHTPVGRNGKFAAVRLVDDEDNIIYFYLYSRRELLLF